MKVEGGREGGGGRVMGERVLGDTNSASFIGYYNNFPQTKKKKRQV
jgi:hypothetical protein